MTAEAPGRPTHSWLEGLPAIVLERWVVEGQARWWLFGAIEPTDAGPGSMVQLAGPFDSEAQAEGHAEMIRQWATQPG